MAKFHLGCTELREVLWESNRPNAFLCHLSLSVSGTVELQQEWIIIKQLSFWKVITHTVWAGSFHSLQEMRDVKLLLTSRKARDPLCIGQAFVSSPCRPEWCQQELDSTFVNLKGEAVKLTFPHV